MGVRPVGHRVGERVQVAGQRLGEAGASLWPGTLLQWPHARYAAVQLPHPLLP